MSDKNVFVICDGLLGPHLIVYANEVTHGGPLTPLSNNLTSGKMRLETVFNHIGN